MAENNVKAIGTGTVDAEAQARAAFGMIADVQPTSANGGLGATNAAGSDHNQAKKANTFGTVTVLGHFSFIPTKFRTLTNEDGKKSAPSALQGRLSKGVCIRTADKPNVEQWVGYGQFSDYVATHCTVILGLSGKMLVNGKLVPALSMVDMVAVCEKARGTKYMALEARKYADAATQARFGIAARTAKA